MNVLVTGGAGFIGANLCKRLISDGHNVWVIDNLSAQVHGDDPTFSNSVHILPSSVNLIVGDILDTRSYESISGIEFDCLIHLAAETGTGQSMYNAKKYFNTNVTGLAFLNDLIVDGYLIKPKKIVLASSRAVYGDAKIDENGKPIASIETEEVNPQSVYATTKLLQEHVLFDIFKDIPSCVLRFQNVYGPGQSLKNPYTGIISIFSTAIKNNQPIQVFEDGLMTRDFVYVDDVVDAICIAAFNDKANGEIFNVGSGVQTTVLDVISTISNMLNKVPQLTITNEKRHGDIRHNFADISKIKRLGFEPKTDLYNGIKNFVNWVDNNNIQNNNYENSINELKKKGLLK